MKDTIVIALSSFSGTLVGATGAILSTYLANRSQLRRLQIEAAQADKQKMTDLKRNLLEEIYVEAESMQKSFGAVFIWAAMLMEGQINANDYNDKVTSQMKDRPVRVYRVDFVIAGYFPELSSSWKNILKIRDRANQFRPISGGAKKIEHTTTANRAAFAKAIEEFDDALDSLKALLAKTVQTLN